MKKFLLIAGLPLLLASCVSVKKLESELAKNQKMQLENQSLMEELEKATVNNSKLNDENTVLKDENSRLKDDTLKCGQQLRSERVKNQELNKLYDDLVNQNKKLLSASSSEKQKLLSELEDQKRELLQKNQDLLERERKVNELEDMLRKKDQAVADLKKRIENALLSFNKDELSVEVRDGKIYVSLAEKLLFKSGSAVVDAKGKDALNKLGDVLAKQTDVDILIEGHTDPVPISTNCIKDNWDLSVMRATSIVRILRENSGINPDRIIASGRAEFLPVASNETTEGKAKNRRTEIILAPKLDEIFKILEATP